MKKNMHVRSIIFLTTLLFSLVLPACSSDDSSSEETTMSLQQYKWVCHTSDDPLVDDDYEWAIFDDYTITLYFVSEYECVVGFVRKHFDTDDGTSYERESQTIKYSVEGKKIQLENSNFTGSVLIYNKEFLSDDDLIYEKKEISSADRDWINENFKHIELDPDESTSVAFKGLKEIYQDDSNSKCVVFGNPQCDKEGRLTYYKSKFNDSQRYEYSSDQIIVKSGTQDSYLLHTYKLTNGIITSFKYQGYDDDKLKFTYNFQVKYDEKKRFVQVIQTEEKSSTSYYYKWNSSGDIYESEIFYRRDNKEPAYIRNYEYYTTNAKLPPMIIGGDFLWSAFNVYIDPILLMEGYFGNSIPKHNLKSYYTLMNGRTPYERYNWSYNLDSKDRISKMTLKIEDLYYNGKGNKTSMFSFKWD